MMDASRLENLWAAFLSDAGLTPDEEQELAVGLSAAPELRARLLRDDELDAALRTLGRCERTEWRFMAGVEERLEAEERAAAPATIVPLGSRDDADLAAGGFGRLHLNGTGRNSAWTEPIEFAPRRRRLPLWIGLAAAASIAISTGVLFWLNREPAPGPGPSPSNLVKNQLRNLEPLPEVARLVEAAECVWEGLKPEGRLAVGPMRLVKGQAKIEFDDGAIVHLTAPAEFSLLSASQGYLHRGSLSAEVPRRARGFKVQTPTALITDLGTRFDVKVDDAGITDVNVRVGKVQVVARNLEGDIGASRWLAKGESWRVEPVVRAAHAAPAFREVLMIDGEPREFTDPEEYEKVRKELLAKQEPKPEPVPEPAVPEPVKPPAEEPKKPVAEAPPKPELKFEGEMEINGRPMKFRTRQQFDQLWQTFKDVNDALSLFKRQQAARGGGMPLLIVGADGFRGVIIINGQQYNFDNRKEFDKHRRELMKQFEPPKDPIK